MNINSKSSSEMPEDLTNNLKELENKSHIKLFKKYNNILVLRDLNKIKEECTRMKKKYIIELSNDLKNLCYTNNIELNKIKELQEKTNNDIHEIDNLMNVINENEYFNNLKQNLIFIEVYEN